MFSRNTWITIWTHWTEKIWATKAELLTLAHYDDDDDSFHLAIHLVRLRQLNIKMNIRSTMGPFKTIFFLEYVHPDLTFLPWLVAI